MTNSTGKKLLLACAIALAVTGAAGCGKSVTKSDVQSQISDKITDSNGKKAESVSCPDDLKGEVGAQINCTFKDGDKTRTVNVTVSSIDGDKVNFDMVKIFPKDEIATDVSDGLTQQLGAKPDSVTCPDDLKGKAGATLKCDATVSGEKHAITVSVDDKGQINWKADD
ncbi:hypothetical protein BOO86_22750 [Mycobacterium sp. CBMA 234]|uniref:DUF4333 domain-containing protein n=1 Tax=Mycolicibacterium sp. CBMA 234 TaxID=1918495 RepID=UPI0012DDF0CD|nr:DUF4333 domain-containing protein [Mycolicibacterium sp. CBMA 234]MUL67311.1 hypothetical protein [Mycolicibacterium sp. CBMA 234]